MCFADRQRACHQVGEVVVARAQTGVARGDRRSAHAGGIACRAAARTGAGDDRDGLAIHEAGDGLAEGRIGLAIQPALVTRCHRQGRLADDSAQAGLLHQVVVAGVRAGDGFAGDGDGSAADILQRKFACSRAAQRDVIRSQLADRGGTAK